MSDEQAMIVETVRRFVESEIIPLEADLDPDAGELAPDDDARLTQMTRDMGFYGLDIPAEYGGPGLDTTTRALMAIEMSKHRAGLYNPCYGVFGGAGLAQLYEATDEQKERWLYPTLRGEKTACFALTEPSGGSDPGRAIRTRGFKDGDEWVLNGSKLFISGADKADYALLFARTSDDPGRKGVTAFIVDTDTPGFNVRRVVHTLRATRYATELEFVDMRVPEDQVLGEVNGGFGIANDRLSRQRIPYAAGCLGPAIMAQEMAIEWARSREAFGSVLAEKQAIQWMIVDNEIDIRHGRWCVLEAAQRPIGVSGSALKRLWPSSLPPRLRAGRGPLHPDSRRHRGDQGPAARALVPRAAHTPDWRRPSEVQRLIMARDILGGSFK